MAKRRGVKFPGRANGEGRRASFSDVSVSEDPSAQNTEQLDKVEEVCPSPSRYHEPHSARSLHRFTRSIRLPILAPPS